MKRLAIVAAGFLLVATASIASAAGSERTWDATIASGGVSGRSALTLASDGRSAMDILWLDRMRTGVSVTAEVRAGACGTTGTHITSLPSFTTTSGGTWRDRWQFGGRDLRALKAALAKDLPITIRTRVGSRSACAEYAETT
jgi:hypothetical protein